MENKETGAAMARSSLTNNVTRYLTALAGAITLFGNLQVVIDIAEWSKWFADSWQALIHYLAGAIFELISLTIQPLASTVTTGRR